MPVAQRLDWCARRSTLFFWERPSQKYIRWAFDTPALNTYGGAPSLPYPTTPLTLRSPKSNYGQLTPKGPTWGCAFCTPILGPRASDPKKKGGQFWEPTILGPWASLALFCSFGPLSIIGTPGPPSHLPIPNLSTANPPILGQT